jgi:AP-1 complex subunit beta-1
MSMFDAPAQPSGTGASSSSAAAPSNNMNDLMNGFEGLNFGGASTSEPLPAAMQLQQAQGGAPQQPKKDSDDLLGLL